MAVILDDFLSRNSTRKYPLDDTASSVSDTGVLLPESFIVDANIWAPEIVFDGGRTLKYLYVASATLSEHLVSITILGTAGPVLSVDGGITGQEESPFIPLATLSVSMNDFVPYKNYQLSEAYEGVSGWVMFGQIQDAEPFSLLFSDPSQSMLAPKTARFYSAASSPGITGGERRLTLLGDVGLVTQTPMSITTVERTIEGVGVRDVIEFNMVDEDGESIPNEDTLILYAGACGGRPESETCSRTPIRFLNGVQPDANGVINVEFQGLTVRRFADGFCIDNEQGLTDACAGAIISDPSLDCELTTPYFNDFDTFDGFSSATGYWYVDGGYLYGMTGGYSAAAGGMCFNTIDEGVSARAFGLRISLFPIGTDIGMYFCDAGYSRIGVITTGDVFVENKATGVRTVLANVGAFGYAPMSVLVTATGRIAGVQIPDEYWVPSGGTGIAIYEPLAFAAKFNSYEVADV